MPGIKVPQWSSSHLQHHDWLKILRTKSLWFIFFEPEQTEEDVCWPQILKKKSYIENNLNQSFKDVLVT